jgi:hypothetical protein
MRVLHFSTGNEQCGTAGYARRLMACLQQQPDIICDLYPPRGAQPTAWSADDTRELFERLLVLASTADLVHIQHEFAGAGLRSVKQFGWLLMQLRQRDVPVAVTFHSNPVLASRYQRVCWRWHVARHFRRGEDRPRAIVATSLSRQLLIASGFDPAQVHVVTGMSDRELAAWHLAIYAALVHQPLTTTEAGESHPYLDLAHAPRVADLFQERGGGDATR